MEEPGYETMMYVQEDETASDELTLPEIIEEINAGKITEETLCWTEGMDNWYPFEECKHLFAWP
jgi:hypothetical protein